MTGPIWIEREECIGFHNGLLAWFGGPDGIRDDNLLMSALERPRQLYHYESPDHFDMAAAYAFGIAKNHPFVDGNKRTALMAAALFLETNGFVFNAPEEQAVLQTLGLAAGEVGEAGYAQWLRESCSPQGN